MSTELEASSRAQTHSRASSSGRLQSAANEAMFSVDQDELVGRGPRDGQRVLAECSVGQVADHRSDLQAEEHRADGRGPLTEQIAEARRRIPPGEGVG